jgi:hypothetical protein
MSDPLGESITRTRRTGGYHLVPDIAASLEAPRSKSQIGFLRSQGARSIFANRASPLAFVLLSTFSRPKDQPTLGPQMRTMNRD